MFPASIPLVTINGKFKSDSGKLHKTTLWTSENISNLIDFKTRKLNFILIKEQGYSIMIYQKGAFKLVIKDINLVESVKSIINKIRKNTATKLFQEHLTMATFRVSQTMLSVHPPFKLPLLTFEKLIQIYPNNTEIGNISIKFEVDHYLHETGCSHFCSKLFIKEKCIGTCNIYNNYKAVVFLSYTSLLNETFNAISGLLQEIHSRCLHLSHSEL